MNIKMNIEKGLEGERECWLSGTTTKKDYFLPCSNVNFAGFYFPLDTGVTLALKMEKGMVLNQTNALNSLKINVLTQQFLGSPGARLKLCWTEVAVQGRSCRLKDQPTIGTCSEMALNL
jgi:hypothetical protein